MQYERYTLHRVNADKTDVVVQYPLTIAGQVYDLENEKFLDASLSEFNQQIVQKADKTETQRLENEKASKVDVSLKANDSEVRKKSVPIEPEDASQRFLDLITGGTVNLETIPQNESVTIEKLSNDLSDSLVIPVTNAIKNGNFANGTTEWSTYASTNSIVDGDLVNTTNGSQTISSLIQLNQDINLIAGHKYYIEALTRVEASDCDSLSLRFRGSANQAEVRVSEILNPSNTEDYSLKGILTIGSQTGNPRFEVRQTYTTAVAGKRMFVPYVTAVNLSLIFGVGNEPTQGEIEEFLSRYPKRWFSGIGNWFNARRLIDATKGGGQLEKYLVKEGDILT